LAAVEAVSVQRRMYEKGGRTGAGLNLDLRLKQQEAESARTQVEHLATTAAEPEEHLRGLAAELDRLRQGLRNVTGRGDAREGGARIAAQITRVERALQQSSEAEAQAARLLEAARGKVEQLEKVIADANTDAEMAARQASDAVRQGHFPDAGAARAAVLPPET